MKTIVDYKAIDWELPKILKPYFEGMRFGVFDIETLGLNPRNEEMILAGFVDFDEEGQVKVTQYFCETPLEECEVLERTIEHLNTFDFVITYNGKHFDMPYVAKRAQICGLKEFKRELYNLDLYLILNGHSPFKKELPNLKQKTVEEYFGLGQSRADEISGKESIDFYYQYLQTEDPAVREDMQRQILLHNHDDILQLSMLIPIIRKCDVHKAMNKLGFPVIGVEDLTRGVDVSRYVVDQVKLQVKELIISGRYAGEGFSYLGFNDWEHPYDSEFRRDGTFTVNYPVTTIKGNTYVSIEECGLDKEEFSAYPNFVNGYLVLKEKDDIHYLEVNVLAREIVKNLFT